MNYRFTAILILMLALLALFGGPVHSKWDIKDLQREEVLGD